MNQIFHAYTPFTEKLPDPGNDQGKVCFVFDEKWKPYLIGAVMLLADPFTWRDDAQNAVNEAQNLLRDLSTGLGCSLIQDIRVIGCTIEIFVDGQWITIGDLSTCGAKGDKGDPGVDGQQGIQGIQGPQGVPGQQGIQGVPGKDGNSGSSGVSNPPLYGTNVTVRCNMAFGVGAWLHEKFTDCLNYVQAQIALGKNIYDLTSNMISAIPILGGLVKAVVNFATDVAEKDIEDLKALNDTNFLEEIQCKLYCYMNALPSDTITQEDMHSVISSLADYCAHLPPRGTQLTLIGQCFALFLPSISDAEYFRRANVYADSSSNTCDLCDCPPPTGTICATPQNALPYLSQAFTNVGYIGSGADYSEALGNPAPAWVSQFSPSVSGTTGVHVGLRLDFGGITTIGNTTYDLKVNDTIAAYQVVSQHWALLDANANVLIENWSTYNPGDTNWHSHSIGFNYPGVRYLVLEIGLNAPSLDQGVMLLDNLCSEVS